MVVQRSLRQRSTDGYATFADFVDAHQVEILRYLTRLTRNTVEAEDLFQETFLRALPKFAQLRAGSNHRAWVYRIATNAFLNHCRRATRRREVALDVAVERSRTAAKHDATITKSAYKQAVALLPPRQRAAFIQRVVVGLSYREVADVMGGTAVAARANVSQAVRRLKRELLNLESCP